MVGSTSIFLCEFCAPKHHIYIAHFIYYPCTEDLKTVLLEAEQTVYYYKLSQYEHVEDSAAKRARDVIVRQGYQQIAPPNNRYKNVQDEQNLRAAVARGLVVEEEEFDASGDVEIVASAIVDNPANNSNKGGLHTEEVELLGLDANELSKSSTSVGTL